MPTTAFAFTSLLTIPVFDQMWVYAVSIAVSFLTSFFLIITFDYRTPEQKAEVLARAAAQKRERCCLLADLETEPTPQQLEQLAAQPGVLRVRLI